MGIIEFHAHDPEMDFSPSINFGGRSDQTEESTDTERDETTHSSQDSESNSGGKGKFLALAVLVGLVLLFVWRRRSTDKSDVTSEFEPDDEVDIHT